MSSESSSTCAVNGSVISTDNESVNNNRTQSSSTSATSSTATAALDALNMSADRIAAYTTNPTDANPSYTHTTTEASIAAHNAAVRIIIDHVDASMHNIRENNRKGSKK
ncbi:hypothetical protein BKA64DRAFT_708278 [Cadophora sp. MPI-SDFR-AT-0126]|nr:hypothetical protein BKA64DRAFT_708278 [Leotiomycetes sp. MPI-SDFR-AT-0126]